jgi:site-specific recombinase XerD
MTHKELLHEFLLTRQNQNTRDRYGRAIDRFLSWYGSTTVEESRKVEDALPVDLLAYLDQQEWVATTKHLHVTAVRMFYRYHFGTSHPINSVIVPKGNARRGRSLSWPAVDALLAIHEPDTAIGTRNIAIIRLMVDAGLRCHEVCELKFANLDMHRLQLEVHGKGDTWETVVFSTVSASAITRWIEYRKSHARCPNLFCSLSQANKYHGKPLTPNGLKTIFKYWSKAVSFRVSPHDLRRTMAVLLCEANANTRVIQLQGRWKNLREVERYTQNLQLNQIRQYLPSEIHRG